MSNLIISKSISSCFYLVEILVFTSVTHLFLRVPLNGALLFPSLVFTSVTHPFLRVPLNGALFFPTLVFTSVTHLFLRVPLNGALFFPTLVFTSVTHLFLRVPLNGDLFFPTGIHLFDDFQVRLYFFRITLSIDFYFVLLFSFLQFCTIIDISSLTSLFQVITNIPHHIRQMHKYQEHNNNHKSKAICC